MFPIPSHDPIESFFNSVHALESAIRGATKDIDLQWLLRQQDAHALQHQQKLPIPAAAPAKRRKGGGVVREPKSRDTKGDHSDAVDWLPFNSLLGGSRPGGRKSGQDLPVPAKGKPVAASKGDVGLEDQSCSGCLHFIAAWSLLLTGFAQGQLKTVKKCFNKQGNGKDGAGLLKPVDSQTGMNKPNAGGQARLERNSTAKVAQKKGEHPSLELLLCCAIDSLVHNLQFLDPNYKDNAMKHKVVPEPPVPTPSPQQFDHIKAITTVIKGKRDDVGSFLSNMTFARVGGAPPSLVDMASSIKDVDHDHATLDPSSNLGKEEAESNSPQKVASGLLNIPLSNVERLRSTLSTVNLTELIEYVPQLGRPSKEHPDKKKLFSVQDFFRYTEAEGRHFFEELDRDGDGQVTLEDLEIAMRKRKLPRKYAKDFFRRTRSHLFSKSFGWKQFLSSIKQKDPTILQAYTTLCLSKSGTLQKNHILTSLQSAGLPANEENAAAMMRYLVADSGGTISYSHFRNFMLLLPSERLEEDPRSIWFEAATVVAVPPPVEIPAENVLKSALAGGLACALSTSLMHPLDTMKTRVQASTLSFPELVRRLPQIGIRGLYRGSIPAIIGQFSSHGLRTGIFEASKLVLVNVAPTLPDIQVQTLASFCSTILGTAIRIPCEVMKQRCQAGIFNNAGEAFVGTLRQDGLKGFFRGTGATLCREVPFYVAGMGLYAEAKKATQNLLQRDLEPWEIILVGALSGGLAAVTTTPFDVMKTRMMTAQQGVPVSMSMVAFSILRQEGPLGLFKGAVPRFFWIAPLGAMNFAGYELAKKAMSAPDQGISSEVLQGKRMANSA